MIIKFATLSRVTVARRTVIKRWNNPTGFPVQFAKWWHCTYCSTVTA